MRGRSTVERVLASLLLAGALASAGGGCTEDLPPSLCGIGECGIDGRGGYCNVCTTMIPYGPHSPWEDHGGLWPDGKFPTTFCNESARKCEVLSAGCVDGWCRVPAGSYVAGAGIYPFWYYERDQHIVVLSRPYVIMETEVTVGAWKRVMGVSEGPLPLVACGDDCPATRLSVFDMLAFANRMSVADGREPCYDLVGCGALAEPASGSGVDCDEAGFAGPDCTGYRLPSEAEWELAAGAASVLCYSDGVPYGLTSCVESDGPADARGWYCANSFSDDAACGMSTLSGDTGPRCRSVHPVGQKLPNRLGLFDVVGNAAEPTGTVVPLQDFGATATVGGGTLSTVTGVRDPRRSPLRRDPGYSPAIRADDVVVLKGGRYGTQAPGTCSYARTGFATRYQPWTESGNSRVDWVGFRLVRTLAPEEDAAWVGFVPADGE